MSRLMSLPVLFTVLALLSAGSGIAAAQQPPVAEGVAAIVNDELISTFDVRQRMRMIIASTKVQPDTKTLQRIQQQALRSLIDEHLQLQETKKYDIDVSQQEIDQAIMRLAQRNDVSIDNIKNDLRKSGISPATLEEQIKAQIAWQILINGRYGSRIRVSNNQIAQTKSRVEASLTKPQYLISEVFLESPSPEQDAVIYQGALSLIKQMQQGAPLDAVARQFSSAPSAAQGGDIGWIHKADLPQEVQAILGQMKPGSLSPPIKVPGGYYIVALRDHKDGKAPMVVNFNQIVAPAGQQKALKTYMKRVKTCKASQNIGKAIRGAFSNPFEDVALNELAPAVRVVLSQLQPGQWSRPATGAQGVTLLMLCARHYAKDAGVPSDEQISEQLINTRLAMLARRYLRDLRRDSTVEIRNK